ncbi:uncharacterized protein YJL077W-B [Saccharomyces cerevisiae S288C]|uniref:Uncharacterized protein YJL077W-B n=2 Tax=Saccharomyces cerevisiae TaxID=4932 RepID=YJ77B_YEAST|nr:uncharacterized protein YJL077W-B [Saccharomyces cerevisiae S288C]Q8TGT3.1 RecName: Full=Uncharacterized protein YJL077W-B [Saccharomyces cerevisiae S288C]AAL79215.1 unknown [Saccharomyces cerevisiae]AJR58796.1 hypothetical protein H668_YJM1129J00137 [Saccharomyces cerevisiae YJM1129]AJR63376.1 hypothetical protein H759_YJM453J00137 [Saccharomyces cerevisiae YJM453]AJR69773.1 hypothetical protein H818_YJM1433J00136 [Saccharomyces cerevisiae YJM1433]AJR73712.1 hypothetical protein H830_YJM1|eukprot:NP_878104.1 hypothetical protein YJL077W-B [Saccharomyces cerevisiae S288C]
MPILVWQLPKSKKLKTLKYRICFREFFDRVET